MKNIGAAAFFLYLFSTTAWAQGQIVSQIVDGEVWQTTMVVTNTTTAPAAISLAFFKETGSNFATQPWNLTFPEEVSPSAFSLAAGETRLLHTPGVAPTLTVGWCQMIAGPGVVAYAIFTKRPQGFPAQVGTSPAVPSAGRILVPFDNTLGNVAAMAIVNVSGAPETISVNIRTTGGQVSQTTLPSIPSLGHAAFTFPSQFPGSATQSGLAEFYTASGSFAILALSFNPAGSLTTAPTYNASGPPIIMGSGAAGSIAFAGFSIGKVTANSGFPLPTPEITEFVGGQFGLYSSAAWALPYSAPTVDSCSMFSRSYPSTGKDPSAPDSALDAGPIAVSGPNLPAGSVVTKSVTPFGAVYRLGPAPGTFALGGTYTITGSGGPQIGPFNISATLPSSFMVNNWNAITAINRANPLAISWTGTGFDTLVITITGITNVGSTTTDVNVTCAVAANLGTYTVPTAALAYLPATTTGFLSVTAATNSGGTVTAVSTNSQSFTPPMVGGGSVNYGAFTPYLATNKSLTIQ